MKLKRFLLAWLAVYIISSITGYIEHDIILHKTYMSLIPVLHSADVKSKIWAFIISAVLGTFFFTIIYTQWQKKETITEGLKYGIFIGIWLSIIMAMDTYASTGLIPFSLAIQWLIYGVIRYAILGIVVSAVFNYKKIRVKNKEAVALGV